MNALHRSIGTHECIVGPGIISRAYAVCLPQVGDVLPKYEAKEGFPAEVLCVIFQGNWYVTWHPDLHI